MQQRRVIRISAADSPNVRLGLLQRAQGREVTGEVLVPGVLTIEEHDERRRTWSKQRQCVGLDATFWVGPGVSLFPPEVLAACKARAQELAAKGVRRQAKALGIDSGQGVANTCWTAGDEMGVVEQLSLKTRDTSTITSTTIAMGRRLGIEPSMWMFDRGGGGLEHADRLRAQGYDCRTVGFGEAVSPEPKRGLTTLGQRVDQREQRYVYKNRRAEMYGEAAVWCSTGIAIPADLLDLLFQLSKMPERYDEEGRLWLPPKAKRDDKDTRKTLTELIGRSPDEADSFVVMRHCMTSRPARQTASVG